MLVYIIHEYIQPLEDTILMIKEWVELHPYGRIDQHIDTTVPDAMRLREPFILTNDPYAYPEWSFAHEMQLNTDFRMRRALEWQDIFLPYGTLLDAFPDVDPTRVTLRGGFQIQAPDISKDVFNKEAERQGWNMLLPNWNIGDVIYP
jgi:hypothetical protein